MAEDVKTGKVGWRYGFWSLIATQFQGVFSDSAFKNLIIFLIIGMGLSQQERDSLVPLVGVLFGLPFLLFSMTGGFLADRFSKRAVTIGTKGMECVVMLLAVAGLATANIYFLFIVVFLMSTQSALFGPSKYGLLPELLPSRRLSWGNGVIEMGTFLAVITGTIAGAWLSELPQERQVWSGVILVGLTVAGLFMSLGISRVPPANPARTFRVNFVGDVWSHLKESRTDRVLFLAIIGNAYFWFVAALLQPLIVIYANDVLGASNREGGILLAATGFGIGLGSAAAGSLSGNKVEYGLIPLGALGMTAFGAVLALPGLSFVAVAVLLALLGFFSGFFIVPVNALIQHRPAEAKMGGVIASASFLSWIGILLSSGLYYLLTVPLGFRPPTIFLVTSAMTLAGTIWAITLLPRSLLRLLLWLLTHTIYRIRVEGQDNIPEKGGALFVCNHLSFVDVALLMASTERSIRFLMYQGYYELPVIKPIARLMGTIPISSTQRPRDMLRSLRQASEVILNGGVVCIFAEGQITRTGQLLPFRRGFERIMKDVQAPIIPVSLEGVWGSIFSFERGRALWKLPRRVPYPVTVSWGKAMPSSATAVEIRQAVQVLQTAAFSHHRKRMQPVHRSFIHTARRHPFRFAMADGMTPKVRFGAALSRSVFLARRIRPSWQGQKMVGILMPPSVAGALVNFAALLLGKVPVNLNYTASSQVLASCAEQCGIQTVVTSKAFLEKVPLEVPGQALLLEEIGHNPGLGEKLTAFILARFLPVRMLERTLGMEQKVALDDLATVIFSSGSTGDPKGVMLSHYNLQSNAQQINQVIPLGRDDRILGVLPFFHSFGFTATLVLPSVAGLGVVYHPNPLDSRVIGALVSRYAATFLLATPTFLQAYIRRCEPEDFGSLRFILAGAEKLPDRIAQAFEDKFGIRPLEGYGCTECSPAVAINTLDFRAAGFRQVGAKRGTIGHPMPGMSVRIVDPDTGDPRPLGEAGLMLVSGPNVMKGYLGNPEKTAEVLQDGWYTTGDIATMDEDGFLAITDRLSRFSKIGGEMVPHLKVEEKLHEVAELTEQAFVVTGVPDEKKGERLVVLYTVPEEGIKEIHEKVSQLGLPKIWVPRLNQFFQVESLPMLGSGKLDLRTIGTLAAELSGMP
jgi:acyl-[acyl-carrier-protein]-phospholipid O-acyltransferase/long-chain-fatty-acid--[acyl-carrier-protein] ligase